MNDKTAVLKIQPKESFKILNSFATEIWNSMLNKRELDEVVSDIMAEYEVDREKLLVDLKEFLEYLQVEKMIMIKGKESKFLESCAIDEKTQVANGTNYNEVFLYYSKENRPFKVFLEITYNCNLRCRHCYLGEDTSKQLKLLSFDEIVDIINQLKKAGVLELVITGGEVASRSDYLDILSYATSQKLMVVLLTNATLINDSAIKEIVQMNLYDCQVSIYGLPQYHDSFVGLDGAFERSMNFLEKLNKEKGIGTGICILTEESYKDIEQIKELFKERKIPLRLSPYIYPTIYGDKKPVSYQINEEQQKNFFESTNQKYGGNLCVAGLSRFRITPVGDVNPCEMLRNIKLGNLRENSFDEIMHNNVRKEWIETFRKVQKQRQCSNCELRGYCGNCIGVAYLKHDDYCAVSDDCCQTARIQYECRHRNLDS
ncbi:PqqD family peptide modification chaperone [Clostridium felsineum]|uniref:PqqD family peptide modification chaperone n=1 Tax=Clostridium felsineum TaxID=36839 RepID=UPI002033EFA3|nr:PqqD family peptide modification chaperone [Clostridium felsineum]